VITPPKYPSWLAQAVGYQIYPQSFQDSNGDGIGDLNGIRARLNYLKDLGVNLIWLSPIYDSPFLDAGYDVRDYKAVAPRYGTLADFKSLINECHAAGLRVMLDLVPGHTSIDHPWFLESCRHQKNPYTQRYVWTNSMYATPKGKLSGMGGFLQGYGEREGAVACNFFWSQPKLNYGVLEPNPDHPWELPFDHPDIRTLWDDMFGIIRFWLDLGVDGFRIDSAKSICPDHPPIGEGRIYRELRAMFDRDYPHAALLTEWGWPVDALAAGVHADFLLHNHKAFNELFSLPHWENGVEHPLFSEGGGDVARFLNAYLPHHQNRNGGLIAIPTGNHDYMRAATERSTDMLRALFATVLTLPGMPFIYYGDEIGMPFLHGLVSKEGGYRRTGARTPMQWEPSGGFSAADPQLWYLPQHPDPSKHNVAAQISDQDSLWHTVRELIELRKTHPALHPDAEWKPLLQSGPTLAYTRSYQGQFLLAVIHPPGFSTEVKLPGLPKLTSTSVLAGRHYQLNTDTLSLGANGWMIAKLS
jgi:maltose alpha-D-glucosyltransferase/alpha-amylase